MGNPDHHHTVETPTQKIPRATSLFEGRDPSYCSEAPPPSPKSGREGTSQLLPPPGCFFFPTPCYFLSPLSPLPLKPFYELSRVTCTSSKNKNRLSPWGKNFEFFLINKNLNITFSREIKKVTKQWIKDGKRLKF